MLKAFNTLGVVTVIVTLTGCTTLESGKTWNIRLRNDTPQSAIVKMCTTSACTNFPYVKRVAAGQTVHATDRGDDRSWWLVVSGDGIRLGCLTLNFNNRTEGYELRISNRVSCPTN